MPVRELRKYDLNAILYYFAFASNPSCCLIPIYIEYIEIDNYLIVLARISHQIS
jgi:hypothetical protein